MIRFKLTTEQRKKINSKINSNPNKIGKTKLSLEKLRRNGKINYSGNKERMTEEVRKKISETMKKKKLGGYRKGSGRGNGNWYESNIAGKVYLDSSYELEYAKYLDSKNVKWKKNRIKFPYLFEGKERFYIPDFYLIDSDEFVETKGYKTDKDEAKWKSFPYKLTVLFKKELEEQLKIKLN